ncbi:MAG: efflux RND transporter permease subunit, partial [Clostridia bacterium]|nr:efflux RND transporter permease subunit [Clostridia bacterium]
EDIGKKLNADLTVQASTMDISMMTGSGIQVEITGDDLQVLQSIAKDVAELARQTEGIEDVDDGLEDAVPELRVEVDKEKATDENLTTGQILQFVAQKVAGRVEITKVTLDGRELSIYLEDGENSELKPEDIENLEIEVDSEDKNKLVRIGDVATIRDSQSLSTINRASQRRMVTVSFGIADGYSANLVSDAFAEKLKGYSLPAGYSADLAGENETVMGIMEDLVWMVLVAILLIFLIMVAQFQSFKSPIIVMFTIPLAFTGGLLALLICKMDLSIVSMLGFLVLSGVVVNNGIVFIDCVNQLRIGGMEKREALVETGRIRLRPILMTALTTILGMSTMALGQGTGAEMMQPMAVVSIGGLSYATLMTLFIVPVLYDLLNGKTMKAREIQMIKEAAGMTGDEVLDGDTRSEAEAASGIPSMAAPVSEMAEDSAPAPATPEPVPAAEGPAPVTPAPATEAPAPVAPAPSAEAPTSMTPTSAAEVPAPVTPAPVTLTSAADAPTSVTPAPAAEAPAPVTPAPSEAALTTAESVEPAPAAAKPLRIRLHPRRG